MQLPSPELAVASPEVLAGRFAQRCKERAAVACAARGRFSLAIPGGSVAEAFLPVLAATAIDWARVDLFWCDERVVPFADPRSNYGLAQRLLRARDSTVRMHMHPLPAEAADVFSATRDYERSLEALLGAPPVLDVVLLGVGEDGHVCSLFPGRPEIAERTRWVTIVDDAPKPPPLRLTVTLPVLAAARAVWIAAFGASKSEAIRHALEDEDAVTPVALALRGAREAWVLLDAGAASLLAIPSRA